MKKIFSGVLYDTYVSKRIIEVDAQIGKRALYATQAGNFFTIENGTELVPMTKAEALEFLRIHQAKVNQLRFNQILSVFFGIGQHQIDPLKRGIKIAEVDGESLVKGQPGGQFYLVTDGASEIVSPTQAIEWLERVQANIPESDFSRIISSHFATIRRA